MHRRRFLAATTAAVAASPFGAPTVLRAAEAPTLSLGLVADPQYADIAPAGTRFYRQSLAKLAEAVAHFNERDLAFCVNVGDLIDRDWQSYDAILAPLAKSRHPFHHVLAWIPTEGKRANAGRPRGAQFAEWPGACR